jgi:tRNA A37 threonylcarbamoyladenosine dehydratase
VGRSKTEVLGERLREINPACTVRTLNRVFSRATSAEFSLEEADYVIDAIDSLTYKLDLLELASQTKAVLYSSMGTALKLDPTQLKVTDIWETRGCPLARLVRSGLRKRGFRGHFTAVYSPERLPRHDEIEVSCGSARCLCPSHCSGEGTEWCGTKKVINGSAVTVTAAAGMILASLVIRNIHGRYAPEPAKPEQERPDRIPAPAHG